MPPDCAALSQQHRSAVEPRNAQIQGFEFVRCPTHTRTRGMAKPSSFEMCITGWVVVGGNCKQIHADFLVFACIQSVDRLDNGQPLEIVSTISKRSIDGTGSGLEKLFEHRKIGLCT